MDKLHTTPSEVYAYYGVLVVYDPARDLPLDGGVAPEELRHWMEAAALVAWEEDQDDYQLEVVVNDPDILDGKPYARSLLRVTGGRVRVGSAEALGGPTDDTFDVEVPDGLYEVRVGEVNPRAFIVHLQPLKTQGKRKPALKALNIGRARRERMRPVPVLRQLRTDAASLTRALTQMGRAARAARDLPTETYVFDGEGLWRIAPDGWSRARPPGHVVVTPEEQHVLSKVAKSHKQVFIGKLPQGDRAFAWTARADVNHHRPIGLEVVWQGDTVLGVQLALEKPLSDQDAAECLSIVQEAFRAGTAVPLRGDEPMQEAGFEQHWTDELLTVRYGPVADVYELPKLSIALVDDAGRVLETLTAPSVRMRDRHLEYEVWLLGRRAAAKRATVSLLP